MKCTITVKTVAKGDCKQVTHSAMIGWQFVSVEILNEELRLGKDGVKMPERWYE